MTVFEQPISLATWRRLARLPDCRTAALLAVPGLELTTETDDRLSTGDLLIVDISDPHNPHQIGE